MDLLDFGGKQTRVTFTIVLLEEETRPDWAGRKPLGKWGEESGGDEEGNKNCEGRN